MELKKISLMTLGLGLFLSTIGGFRRKPLDHDAYFKKTDEIPEKIPFRYLKDHNKIHRTDEGPDKEVFRVIKTLQEFEKVFADYNEAIFSDAYFNGKSLISIGLDPKLGENAETIEINKYKRYNEISIKNTLPPLGMTASGDAGVLIEVDKKYINSKKYRITIEQRTVDRG